MILWQFKYILQFLIRSRAIKQFHGILDMMREIRSQFILWYALITLYMRAGSIIPQPMCTFHKTEWIFKSEMPQMRIKVVDQFFFLLHMYINIKMNDIKSSGLRQRSTTKIKRIRQHTTNLFRGIGRNDFACWTIASFFLCNSNWLQAINFGVFFESAH